VTGSARADEPAFLDLAAGGGRQGRITPGLVTTVSAEFFKTLPVCDDVTIHRRPVYLHEMFQCGDVVVFVRLSSYVTPNWFLISV